ncbi:hypothetical protein WN48_10363 [Eufriesea mexicana]|nr:hypothetical protein WN48_10363 [Eufriesea mexicana]
MKGSLGFRPNVQADVWSAYGRTSDHVQGSDIYDYIELKREKVRNASECLEYLIKIDTKLLIRTATVSDDVLWMPPIGDDSTQRTFHGPFNGYTNPMQTKICVSNKEQPSLITKQAYLIDIVGSQSRPCNDDDMPVECCRALPTFGLQGVGFEGLKGPAVPQSSSLPSNFSLESHRGFEGQVARKDPGDASGPQHEHIWSCWSALKTLGAKLRNGGNVAVGAAKALPYHSAQPFVVRKGEPGTGCR